VVVSPVPSELDPYPPFPGMIAEEEGRAVSVAVTGQTVVYNAIVSVVMVPEIEYEVVPYTVEVVYFVTAGEEVGTPPAVSVAVTGQIVV